MPEVGPIPCFARKRVVQEAAEQYAERIGFAPGGALEAVVDLLGGRIHYRDFIDPEHHPESIRVRGDRDFDIFVPLDTPPVRDRFTVAHELGHLLLHYPIVRARHGDVEGLVMVANRYLPDQPAEDEQRCEWEANWFAAAFLMPSAPFIAEWTARNGDVEAVARHFHVSVSAARNRVDSLRSASML